MSTSKTRIQNYLRQNKISELFEEMMGKLVKDLPASPIYYLVNFLQDKEKKIKQIVRDDAPKNKDKKIELSSNAKLWATAPVPVKSATSPRDSSPQQTIEGRKYDKPWLTHSKKSPSKSKSGKLSQTTPIDTKESGKPNWSRKTKLSIEKQDDVTDGDDGVDLGLVYAKPRVVGENQVKIRSAEEEMRNELSLAGVYDSNESTMEAVSSTKISAKDAKRKRQEELRRLAEVSQPKSKPRSNSPIVIDDGTEDDALEVLEDASELIGEGVKNPPKTGVVLGQSRQTTKEEIELVLNMSKFFDELGGMEGINQPKINGSRVQNTFAEEDDDFESASQVTGPRRPVWEAPESEVESVASQLRSARISGLGVDSFVTRPDTAEKPKEERKPEQPKRKTSEPRPRTAPSRTRSNVDLHLSNGNTPMADSKPTKSPRSRPTTPKGSVVGSGRASRRASQTSQHSNIASATKKNGSAKEREKKHTSDQASDAPDGNPKEP